MADKDYVEIFKAINGEFRWRRKAANNETVSGSEEGFVKFEWADRSARNYNRDVSDFRDLMS